VKFRHAGKLGRLHVVKQINTRAGGRRTCTRSAARFRCVSAQKRKTEVLSERSVSSDTICDAKYEDDLGLHRGTIEGRPRRDITKAADVTRTGGRKEGFPPLPLVDIRENSPSGKCNGSYSFGMRRPSWNFERCFVLTGTRSGYFRRIFSPSAFLFSNGCSSLYWNFIVPRLRAGRATQWRRRRRSSSYLHLRSSVARPFVYTRANTPFLSPSDLLLRDTSLTGAELTRTRFSMSLSRPRQQSPCVTGRCDCAFDYERSSAVRK